MKKIVIALLLLTSLSLLIGDDFELSGTNEMEVIYKAVDDSLNTYFYNELSLLANYKDLVFGMKFLASLPKYESDNPIEDLDSEDVKVEWDERYLTFERDDLLLHIGTTEDFVGSGLLFRSYRDEDVDVDTRLEAALIKAATEYFEVKGLYGAMPSEDYDANELAGLFDIESSYIPHTKIGASYFQNERLKSSSAYYLMQAYGFRMTQEWDYFDFYGEYARTMIDEYDFNGEGYYANLNAYFGEFSINGAYKKFWNMNYDLNDVPTANYHEETLSDDLASGADEEGFMGELSWDQEDEKYHLLLSYAEAWDSDKDRQMNDFFGAFGMKVRKNEVTAECGYWEKVNDAAISWQREITPALVFDIPTETLGFHIKTEMQRIEKENNGVEANHWEPLLQTDVSYGDHSLSIIAETNIEEFGDATDSRYFVNAEFRTTIYENTDVVLFAGSEKGGKVCRNGVCKTNKPFDGVRLELITRF